jgi:hypothetical protein
MGKTHSVTAHHIQHRVSAAHSAHLVTLGGDFALADDRQATRWPCTHAAAGGTLAIRRPLLAVNLVAVPVSVDRYGGVRLSAVPRFSRRLALGA